MKTIIGEITGFAGEVTSLPGGYLLCDGSAISRNDYKYLFDVIGTTYGVGDGTTTFNLPDAKGRILVGYNASDADFNTVGKTGGSSTANMQHSHTQKSHHHVATGTTAGDGLNAGLDRGSTYGLVSNTHTHPFTTDTTAANAATTNSQLSTTQNIENPYIAIHFIIRAKPSLSQAAIMFFTLPH